MAVFAFAAPAASEAKPAHTLRVMTRNLYLGADLTPGLEATSLPGLNDAAGEIFRQVKENDFPVRARGLAQEILKTQPDLVGLQEAALWRTEPTCKYFVPPGPYTATHVVYDYINLLLGQLNKGKQRYRLVVAQPEFDFETEANTDGSPDHSCDEDIRLTMRDAILARVNDGVQIKNLRKGHYKTLFAPKLVGVISVPVTRGWVSADVRISGSHWVRFVDTHLESYDNQASNPTNQGTEVGNGQIRQAQARELIKKGGPATGSLPVILVGDLNSDVTTALKPGDGLADRALLNAGFRERSTYKPLSCCLDTNILTAPGGGGKISDFNHKVDHVMTDDPKQITLIESEITGRHPVNGFWDSDHSGTFSVLSIPGPSAHAGAVARAAGSSSHTGFTVHVVNTDFGSQGARGRFSAKLGKAARFVAAIMTAVTGVPYAEIAKGGTYVAKVGDHGGLALVTFSDHALGTACVKYTDHAPPYNPTLGYLQVSGSMTIVGGTREASRWSGTIKFKQSGVTGADTLVFGGSAVGATRTSHALTPACKAVAKLKP